MNQQLAYLKNAKTKPPGFTAMAILISILLFYSCASSKVKTFVDPAIQSQHIKSVAVFPLRNTALSPGEAIQIDKSITQAFLQKNKGLNLMGASESTSKINAASMADEYSKFLFDFEHSGIPNTNTLKKIGAELGVDAILQGTLADVIQRDGSYPGASAVTSLTLRYTLISVDNGAILWEGIGNARKTGATTFSKAAPLYEVIEIAQKKILTGLPVLGK